MIRSEAVPGAREPRFSFGRNWRNYVGLIDEPRIASASRDLTALLDVSLRDRRFLDVGCGSGLSSLVAWREGATVHSFDYDPDSVQATLSIRQEFSDGEGWTVEQGDVLDPAYMSRLGRWDVVYSWGVLHHTGDMWRACAEAAELVADDGRLFIAIYNDQGLASHIWRSVKRLYNQSGPAIRWLLLVVALMRFWGPTVVRDAIRGDDPRSAWRQYGNSRGMSAWHDLVDWVGGYPFEVATPQAVCSFYLDRGFRLVDWKLVGRGIGCNQFVFARPPSEKD